MYQFIKIQTEVSGVARETKNSGILKISFLFCSCLTQGLHGFPQKKIKLTYNYERRAFLNNFMLYVSSYDI